MLVSLLLIAILAGVHIFANKISALHSLSRCRWLSLAGGISIAYVFVHLLPELHVLQTSLMEKGKLPFFVEKYLFIMALIGILLFYSLEKIIVKFQEKNASDEDMAIEDSIFWWHIGIFAAFNMLIGIIFTTN